MNKKVSEGVSSSDCAPSQPILNIWHASIKEPLRSTVLTTVNTIVERLRSPEHVLNIGQEITNQPGTLAHFHPPSFSSGFASVALPFRALAKSFPGQGWENPARTYLRLAAQGTQEYPLMQPGIFGGSSGLATAISLFYADDRRYQKTWNTLNADIAQQVRTRNWKRETFGVADGDYDAIAGAAGILGYLITIPSPSEAEQEAINTLLEYLVWLCDEDGETGLARWYISPEYFPLPLFHEQYPEGYFNLGLSHGIAGPLAALSLAWQANHRVEKQYEAIARVSGWIVEHQVQDHWGINWPSGVPLQLSYTAEQWETLHPTRNAWCYGAPGIVRSLWLAGRVLHDERLCRVALEGIEAVLRRPLPVRNIDAPTICHGVAGLLMICLRFADETESQFIHEQIPELVSQLLAQYDPDTALGFRDEESSGVFIDDPGLLTGVSGILLVLLAAATATPPDWDRAFLIA